jgi:hypothetical protein
MNEAGAIYPLNVQVADNGTPSLSASQSFNVTVTRPGTPLISGANLSQGSVQFQISGDAGPDYMVYVSSDLGQTNWALLLATNSPALPFYFTDPQPAVLSRRFYRVQLGP